MKKVVILTLLAVVTVVAGPVLIRQLDPPEHRSLEGETLDPTRFDPVAFRNDEQALDLAGMLYLPPGDGPFPAAVIIHGSGTSRRDNRWYLTLTHFLQDSGIAVLLPDKRGSEQSGGDWRSASFEDLATDTAAAVRYLTTRLPEEIAGVGVIGMSQGGWIAPIVADRMPDVSFVVNVVGAAVTTHQQLVYEEDHNLRQMGVLPGISRALAHVSAFSLRAWRQHGFWSAVGNFDPLPYWRPLDVPALVLYGEIDTNTPSRRSADLLEQLDNPRITIRMYEGSGHALQDPAGRGDRLIRQDALADIRDFIRSAGDRAPGRHLQALP